jgi:hypothetical protein
MINAKVEIELILRILLNWAARVGWEDLMAFIVDFFFFQFTARQIRFPLAKGKNLTTGQAMKCWAGNKFF